MNEHRKPLVNFLWLSLPGFYERKKKSVRVKIYQKSVKKLASIYTDASLGQILCDCRLQVSIKQENPTIKNLPKKRHRNAHIIILHLDAE